MLQSAASLVSCAAAFACASHICSAPVFEAGELTAVIDKMTKRKVIEKSER